MSKANLYRIGVRELNTDVISCLECPLAAEVIIPRLLTTEKAHITSEQLKMDALTENHVRSVDRCRHFQY